MDLVSQNDAQRIASFSADPEIQQKLWELKEVCRQYDESVKDKNSREAEVLKDTAPHWSFS